MSYDNYIVIALTDGAYGGCYGHGFGKLFVNGHSFSQMLYGLVLVCAYHFYLP